LCQPSGVISVSEEKIRKLCSQLLAAQNEEAISRLGLLLREALREHYEEANKRLAIKFRFSPYRDIARN